MPQKKYCIPMDEELAKGRIPIIKDELDALIYFYPQGSVHLYIINTKNK